MTSKTDRALRGAFFYLTSTIPVPPAEVTLDRLYKDLESRERTQERRRLDASALLAALNRLRPPGGFTASRRELATRYEEAVLAVLAERSDEWLEAYDIADVLTTHAPGSGAPTYGTLYRQLRVLADQGLIDRIEEKSHDDVSEIRRRYRINPAGLTHLAATRQATRRPRWARLHVNAGGTASSTPMSKG